MAIRRSIHCVCVAVAALLTATASAQAAPVLVLGRDGHVSVHHDRLGPQPSLRPGGADGRRPPVAAAARTKTVPSELKRLLAAGAIDEPTYRARRAAYLDTKRVARKLRGSRGVELRAVVSTLDGIAARGSLTASRLEPLWLTLERNRQWWTTGPLLAYGQRIGFTGSELIWQYFPGQGIQFHPLANFGKLNGLWGSRVNDTRVSQLLDELLALGVQRAGGIAWEYYFTFDGGRPPWVSSLAQGTGLQAIARSAARLGRQDEVYPIVKAGLAIFKTPPPLGVRVPSPSGSGTHYLQYSYDRNLYILNGFIQSLNGLNEYAKLTKDPEGRALFEDGVKAATREVPQFDTGAWSLYSRGDDTHESDLSYHKLLRDFMRGLCGRTDDQVFCDAVEHYDRYLVEKPALALLTTRVRGRTLATLRLKLSKISRIGVRITRADGKPVLVRQVGVLPYGRRSIAWSAPRRKGIYTVALTAVDLAGNTQSVSGPVEVLKPKKRRG